MSDTQLDEKFLSFADAALCPDKARAAWRAVMSMEAAQDFGSSFGEIVAGRATRPMQT